MISLKSSFNGVVDLKNWKTIQLEKLVLNGFKHEVLKVYLMSVFERVIHRDYVITRFYFSINLLNECINIYSVMSLLLNMSIIVQKKRTSINFYSIS